MEWLNYHHLYYFWMVAREGTVVQACEKLNLAQSTVSGQLRSLEEALGQPLFNRVGRGLVLTDVGQTVYRYADEIFSLGRELMDTLRARPTGRAMRLNVGVADVVPKLITHRILQPVLQGDGSVHLICREGKTDQLLADLSLHALDMVIADAPLSSTARVRAFNHPLGDSGISFCGVRDLVEVLRPGFPASLDGAPMLLPTDNTTMRRNLDQWMAGQDIRPQIVGEFEDSALMKAVGQSGVGVFPVPTAMTAEVVRQFGVVAFGDLQDVREQFYAITVERRIKHPAVAAIVDGARRDLFAHAVRERQVSPGSRDGGA